MLDIYFQQFWSIAYVMSQSILFQANHKPCFVHLFLQIHMEDTTNFPLGLRTISQTSFLMINCYSLIIASSQLERLASMMSPNYVTQLECVQGLLIWFGILAIILFILSYISYPWWYSSFQVDLPLSEALSSVMVSLTLGASDSCLLE